MSPRLLLPGLLALAVPLAGAHGQTATPATPAALAATLRIPYDSFVLPNGLRVIVNTDRRLPLVSIAIAYGVGSIDEPRGRSGFAHLFEHLMFSGSENVTGDFPQAMQAIGATQMNGGTTYDYTSYHETVPVNALARALFLESDRMGHLLGAVGQARLDAQRGVVQNEKRENDNAPYGMMSYKQIENIYPADHPYGHPVIGSMQDLDAADLGAVRDWFRHHYAPNNAVLALSGDIDLATARGLVERYFGAIPRAPARRPIVAPVPVLPASRTERIADAVPLTVVSRSWPVPGGSEPDSDALEAAAALLGGSETALLNRVLVTEENLAAGVTMSDDVNAHGGMFTVAIQLREGVTLARVQARLDALLAGFLSKGPDRAAMERALIGSTVGMIGTTESTAQRAMLLTVGASRFGDPDFYLTQLKRRAALTPAAVRDAARRWLSRPSYTLVVEPGARPAYAEAAGAAPAVPPPPAPERSPGTRTPPPIGPAVITRFPAVERLRLSNGISVLYARSTAAPLTRVALTLAGGYAADPVDRPGTGAFALAMMTTRTAARGPIDFGVAREALGATLGGGVAEDGAVMELETPSANLRPAIDLLAEAVTRPAFDSAPDLARTRDQMLAAIAQADADPDAITRQAMATLLYGATHPYARPGERGTATSVKAITADALADYWRAWVRPDKARVLIVSDRPPAEVQAALEHALGGWRGLGEPGAAPLPPTAPAPPRLVLIDRPGVPQASILLATPNGVAGTAPMEAVDIGNDALGAGFTSRLNAVLREEKHWTYGVGGRAEMTREAAPYVVSTSVQTDRTGPAIAELRRQLSDFVGPRPMTSTEFATARKASIDELPSRFATGAGMLGALKRIVRFERQDDYYAALGERLAAVTLPQARTAMAAMVRPERALVVVTGDAATIRPQLAGLGLPIIAEGAKLAD